MFQMRNRFVNGLASIEMNGLLVGPLLDAVRPGGGDQLGVDAGPATGSSLKTLNMNIDRRVRRQAAY
jgi:hypothetical protein